jgi:mRNA-degrading endonuclease toxin of MazEF toxin-antitoxin module
MPTSDARLAPGTAVRVPFPHTDADARQRRPALVIATTGPETAPFLLWVLMITSAAHRRWSGDVEVPDPASIGLLIPSVIRTAKIATVEIARADPLGQIAAETLDHVRARVGQTLGI